MDALNLIEYTPSFLKEIKDETENAEMTHLTGFDQLEKSLQKTLEEDTLVFDLEAFEKFDLKKKFYFSVMVLERGFEVEKYNTSMMKKVQTKRVYLAEKKYLTWKEEQEKDKKKFQFSEFKNLFEGQ